MDGEPVPDAGVKASGVTVQAHAWTRTGSDGRFRLQRLPRGEIDVEAYKDMEEPDERILSTHVGRRVPAGTVDLRLVLP